MSTLKVFYNEIDQFCCAWISNLMDTGLITPGVIDDRPIEDLSPDDVNGYDRAHFFAGIAVWDYALNQSQWPDDSPPTWTGSCPCQGFSASGRRGGFSDKRHLWPAWFRLIRECRPVTVFGEQVASKDGLAWFDLVSADLEGADYAIGAADICAAGFGAPHIRQRLYFVADANTTGRRGWRASEASIEPGTLERSKRLRAIGHLGDSAERGGGPHNGQFRAGGQSQIAARGPGPSGSVANTGNAERRARTVGRNDDHAEETGRDEGAGGAGKRGTLGNVGHANNPRSQGQPEFARSGGSELPIGTPGFTNGFWRDAEWIYCRDEKWRPIEPGTFPLVTGTPNRVGRLRGYGNAINAEVAQAFIEAYMSLER